MWLGISFVNRSTYFLQWLKESMKSKESILEKHRAMSLEIAPHTAMSDHGRP